MEKRTSSAGTSWLLYNWEDDQFDINSFIRYWIVSILTTLSPQILFTLSNKVTDNLSLIFSFLIVGGSWRGSPATINRFP